MGKELNLDTFGEIMDEFIRKNKIQMLITLPEESITAEIQDNCNVGSVMQFYIILNAISSVANQMKKEMGIDGAEWENVVDTLLQLVKMDLLEPEAEKSTGKEG